MKGRRRAPTPVTVTWAPIVRCTVCGRTMVHHPGMPGVALTAHYEAKHPELIRAPRHVAR